MPEKKTKSVRQDRNRPGGRTDTVTAPVTVEHPVQYSKLQWGILLGLVTSLFLWSYWPTLVGLVQEWYRVPDYSHGFLVIPISIYFLWISRDHFIGSPKVISWAGVSLIVVAIAVRLLGSIYYLEALQGWSIPIWIT
jgi:hypothetical protein